MYDGDAYTIEDLNFAEGDTLTMRSFDANTFSNNVDPDNHFQMQGNSLDGAIFNSLDDIVEAHVGGALTASALGADNTLLTMSVGGKDIFLFLKGIDFDDLNIPGSGGDLSPGNDTMSGGANNDNMQGWGGDDTMLMRFGSDTAIGGAGADQFAFDGRYVNDGDSHTIKDLDFSAGDTLLFRYMDAGSFDDSLDLGNDLDVSNGGATASFDSVEDILEAAANGILTGADQGFGTLLTIDVGGNTLNVTLDGWDIF